MEFVSFYFCESVCVILKNLGVLEIVCRNNPDCYYWTAAIKEEIVKRPKFSLDIDYVDEKWTYSIYNNSVEDGVFHTFSANFEEFKLRVKNQCYRLTEIAFGPMAIAQCTATEEELNQLVKFTAPYVCKTEFRLPAAFDHFRGEKPFNSVLSILKERPLQKIVLYSQHELITQFLRAQLHSGHLQELIILGKCSDEFNAEIKEFALTGTLCRLQMDCFQSLDLEFFNKLYRKPLDVIEKCEIMAWFPTIKYLKKYRQFEKDGREKRSVDGRKLSWKRSDGVTVRISSNKTCQLSKVVLTQE